jgi:hypothetical protein
MRIYTCIKIRIYSVNANTSTVRISKDFSPPSGSFSNVRQDPVVPNERSSLIHNPRFSLGACKKKLSKLSE